MVTVGVHVRENPAGLAATLASLVRWSTDEEVVVVPDDPEPAVLESLPSTGDYAIVPQGAAGAAAAFNRLTAYSDRSIVVLLESGSIVTSGWLDRIREGFERDPRAGLAGPSTNLCWNPQRVAGTPAALAPLELVDAFAAALAGRAGNQRSTLEPLYSLSDFCYAVKRNVVAAIGPADEQFGDGPCWEMEYNARAARAGFAGLWVHASYVHRRPIGARRLKNEARLFADARRRYQDRVCGLQLTGARREYCTRCEGDTCTHFAPVQFVRSQPDPPPVVRTVAEHPMVSCIMPTCDRRVFVGRAVAQFLAQDYPHRELIVVDDGGDSIADLLPQDPRVRLIRSAGRMTVGEKRNRGCEAARGALVAHWDDDDWMAPHRLRYQVGELVRTGADVCGLSRLYFYDPAGRRAWQYVYPQEGRPWLAGGTLCYRKSVWHAHRFADVSEGEDTRFVWGLRDVKLLSLDDETFYVATIHDRNTSRKRLADRRYRTVAASVVERLIDPARHADPLVSCIMPTSDRRRFVPLAIEYFQRQEYASRELIVVDDGRDRVDDLIPPDPRIRYIAMPRASLGEKRNAAIRSAAGEYIAHWDDDDWYGPGRLAAQMAPIIAGEADVTALSMRHVLALDSLEFWRCEPALHARLHFHDLCCGTIVFGRRRWECDGPYPPFNVAEDVRFLQRMMAAGARVRRIDDDEQFVCVRHGRNTWRIVRDWSAEPGGWTAVERPAGLSETQFERYRALAGAGGQTYVAVA
jgi:glycosyltransferase involved in cell wall biosynthesis